MNDVRYARALKRRLFELMCLFDSTELAFDEDSHAKVVSNANAEQNLIVHNLKRECGGVRDASTNDQVRRVFVEAIKFGTKHEL